MNVSRAIPNRIENRDDIAASGGAGGANKRSGLMRRLALTGRNAFEGGLRPGRDLRWAASLLALAITMLMHGAFYLQANGGRAVQAQEAGCIADLSRVARPREIALGETVQVTMNIRLNCPESEPPLHIVFAIDTSGSMAGQAISDTLEAVSALVDHLDLPNHPETRIGIVAFAEDAVALCELSNAASRIRSCLTRIEASGGSRVDLGIEASLEMMRRGRVLPAPGTDIRETILVLSDGASQAGCAPVLQAAATAKGQGILLISICVGDACDTACMRQIASSARYFFQVQEANQLQQVFDRIRDGLNRNVRQLELIDRVPPNMRYVEGSSEPPALWDPGSRNLSWLASFVPAEGMTVSFGIEPLEIGPHPSSADARALWRDNLGAVGEATFPIEAITVSAGLPTMTPPLTPIPGPQPLAGLDLSTTELAIGETASVTYQLDFDLPETPGETHLALVADTSGSMAGESFAKLQEGAGLMLDRLESLASDRFAASITEFNSAARTLCNLTADFGRLRACVYRLGPAAGGTSIDSGLREGHRALRDGRPWDFGEDLVLFSDGANNSGCGPVSAAADAIKAEDIVVHTVCLGTACDAACLRQAASSPRHFFQIDQAGALPDALGGIADDLLSRRGVEGVDLELTLPGHLRVLPGSFSIAPDSSAARSAAWMLRRMPADGIALTFELEALAPGDGQIELGARLTMLDAAPIAVEARSVPIRVPGSPTAGPPSETPGLATATPSLQRPSDTAPPSAVPSAIYLPLLLHEACAGAGPTDLVLLLDSSLSMAEAARDGGSKLDAALEAARGLIEALDLGAVRVAVIGFDAEAHLRQSLTADVGLLNAALRPPALASGTAIDRGIAAAHAELLGPHSRGDVRRVMVLLTDGRAFPSSPAEAIAAAVAARTAGIEIHAVGLGNEVDAATLRAVASSAALYRAAAGRLELLRAFRVVAGDLACPGRFWNAGG